MAAHLIVDAAARKTFNTGMKRILAALLLLTLAAPAWGQDFERGQDAYVRGDYAAALREWRPIAEQGNVKAQSMLGLMYDMGKGVPQEYAEARKWSRKATEQGHYIEQVRVGMMYDTGKGVPQDCVQAHKWFNLRAASGQPD